MFPETSRYHGTEITSLTLPDGREVQYLRRRFVPQPQGPVEEEVLADKRLDQLTNQKLHNPKLFWKLCDFNRTLDPLELEQQETVIRIPSAAGQGAIL